MSAITNLRAKVDRLPAGTPPRYEVTITLAEARELLGETASLTDLVVTAGSLWFDEITDPSERDYASEALHETATELVRANPRLKGAYKGADV